MLPDLDSLADVVVLTIAQELGPVLERLVAAETRLAMLSAHEQTIGALRDRLLLMEARAAMPSPELVLPDVAPLLVPIADRVKALEDRPAPHNGKDGERGEHGERGDQGLQGAPGERGPEGPAGPARDGRDGLPGVPGAGEKGMDGANGVNGKDGADGLGFDDMQVLPDGERSVTFRFIKGDRVKDFTVTFPVPINRGVYLEGKAYDRCDVVTWAGSTWNANEPTTTKPGEGSKAWTLIVKRGRDGRDGLDAPGALPVVKVGSPK